MSSGAQLTVAVFHESSRWSLALSHIEQIREAVGDALSIVQVRSGAELVDALPATTHLLGTPSTADDLVPHLEHLKFIQLAHGAGDATPSVTSAVEAGIPVASAASVRAPQVSEHAMALMLALIRRLDGAMIKMNEHSWSPHELAPTVRTLHGATVGIIALGPVATELRVRLGAFGAITRFIGFDPDNPDALDLTDFTAGPLMAALDGCDVVVVATPRLPATSRLIGRKELAALPAHAILIDVSRGGVVRSEALIDALRRGKLAGAGLDVFEDEPLPSDSPYWTMQNVLVTPHIAAASPDYWDRACAHFCNNLRRILDGQDPIDLIRPSWLDAPKRT